jgi:hypothetical protein
MIDKKVNFRKNLNNWISITLAILIFFLLALLKSGGKFSSDDNSTYSSKELEISYEGVFIEATQYFKDEELTKIEGKLYLLNSQIYDEDTDESTVTFWSKEYGYSSTCESLFKILSESHKREIENQFFKDNL